MGVVDSEIMELKREVEIEAEVKRRINEMAGCGDYYLGQATTSTSRKKISMHL